MVDIPVWLFIPNQKNRWHYTTLTKLTIYLSISSNWMDTMSWFDATGFANLAKTALKEAQKTIDKALDIKEEEERGTQSSCK